MPPEALLKVLATLQARHERRPSEVSDILEKMLKENPLMKKPKHGKPGYVHQGEPNDRLFEASYQHVEGSDCSNCDSHKEIKRDRRDSTEPEIHYGVIALGNGLIKDGVTRDSIIRWTDEDCICFEMEAAGLMNSFPCLVIRGICDYADSHKNDRWQRYAAATAADYAKEFLSVVPAEDLKRTEKAIEALKKS
jgi:nucleoside phosphorylase